MAEIPRLFHFVFGLRPQTEPFHLAHYLCLESCRRVNRPERILFHYRNLPHGPWWDRIAPHLTLLKVPGTTAGFDPGRYLTTSEGRYINGAGLSYAHEADFIRQDALIEHGGVYADIDTLFVKPYPAALFRHECVLGEESPIILRDGIYRPSLCNAVLLAQPGARFMRRWRQISEEVFDGTWSRHSCEAASELWYAGREPVHVAPRRLFYRFGVERASFVSLFEESSEDLRDVCSIHLWSHLWWSATRRDLTGFHAGLLTERYVREADTTYARLARPFLVPDGSAQPAGAPGARRASRRTVLFYNFPAGHPRSMLETRMPDGHVLSTNRDDLPGATAVVFHLPTLAPQVLPAKRPGQLWVGWSQECEVHYPRTWGNPDFMRQFDLTLGYRRDADVAALYFQPDFADTLRTPPQEKDPGCVANALISSRFDASGRLRYLERLLQVLPVHSYGKVLNNRAIGSDTGRATKMAISARYPFTLAFENAIARDYVTEKFFDPLVAGSVPVYLGAPNIDDFAPGEDCYIDASAFPDPRDLAAHLLALAGDPAAYRRHLAWKSLPFRPAFIELLAGQREPVLGRLCRKIDEALRQRDMAR